MKLPEAKKKYLENPKSYRANLKEQLGIDVKQINFYDDNEPFINMIHKMEAFFNSEEQLKKMKMDEDFAKYKMNFRDAIHYSEPSLMHSIVGTPKGFNLNVHNLVTIYITDGSYIQIAPLGEKKLEITRMEVMEKRLGVGSLMLEILFRLLAFSNGYIPAIKAECTGVIGFGENTRTTPLLGQKKFFQKNGFVVKVEHPRYIELERPKSKGKIVN